MNRAGFVTAARVAKTAGLAATLAVLAACGSPRRDAPLVGPVESADASVQRGRILFDQNCYKCHGQGEGALGPGMNHLPLPKPMMRMQIRVGMGTMPGFPEEELSDRDVDDILDYLVALRRHGR
jgi:mono/diheme cytochrome c family protein